MATYDFHGEVRTPCPLCLRFGPNKHTAAEVSFKQFEFTFYLFFFAGPGQFTKPLLIISADAKGKDCMILFKIKKTMHINSRPRVVLKFGVARDDGLDSGPGVTGFMRGSRIFSRGGGGGGGSRPMFFLVINLFYNLQSGSNGFITEGRRGSNFFQGVGVSKETHMTCDFPGGGPDPLPPSGSARRVA